MMMALKKIGPKNVAIRNHLDRTRSRYSLLMIAQSLAMSGHSLFDAGGTDFLKENLMQRRLDHLESLHCGARFDDPAEQRLWISPRRTFRRPLAQARCSSDRVLPSHPSRFHRAPSRPAL